MQFIILTAASQIRYLQVTDYEYRYVTWDLTIKSTPRRMNTEVLLSFELARTRVICVFLVSW